MTAKTRATIILILLMAVSLSGLTVTRSQPTGPEQAADYNDIQAQTQSTANPNAVPAAKAILSYLYSLSDPSRTTNRIIIGQFGSYGEGADAASATQQLQSIYDQTGKWAGLTGMDYRTWDMHNLHNFSEPNQFLINQWKKGMLVTVSWHAANPWTNGSSTDWDSGNGTPRNVRELITPGNAAYKNWIAMLDDVASGLKQLQDAGVVVIWRPLHELNGGWFWWHQQTQADFIALWQHMFNYFTTTKGLNNLLWAYSPNTNNNQWNQRTNYYYPGNAYVDIVGLDKYMKRGEDPLKINDWHEYDDLVATGRPVGLLEFGPSPADASGANDPKYDWSKLPRDIRSMYPKIVFFQAWEWIWQIGNGTNLNGLVNDPWTITLDEMPNWQGGTATLPTSVPPTTVLPTATKILPTATKIPPTVTTVPPIVSAPTSAATPTLPAVPTQVAYPATSSNFYRAINFNGPALTIDGKAWEGGSAPNFKTNGWGTCDPKSSLNPATDAARATMLRCAIVNNALSVTLSSVPNATYDVYLYVWENDWPEIYSLALEGKQVVTNYNSIGAGYWAKLGPFTTTVADGALNLTSTGWVSNLSGIEVWTRAGGVANAPTATSVPPTTTKAPTTVPPTATKILPTVTKVPATATKVLPTATKVLPTATNVPAVPTQVAYPATGSNFYRAINFNGPALTIDGQAWEGSSAPNFKTNGWGTCDPNSKLNPATDAARATMLRCAIVNKGLTVTLSSVPNATYDVYLYVWENDWPEIYSLALEGKQVVANYNSIGAGYWSKLGPFMTTVADGALNLTATGWVSNLSGIEVWMRGTTTNSVNALAAPVDDAPAVAPTSTAAPQMMAAAVDAPVVAPTTAPAVAPTVAPATSNTVSTTSTVALQTIESDNPAVQPLGKWTAVSADAASGNRYLYSSGSLNDSLNLSFQGSSLDVVYVKHPTFGSFAVDIDGAVVRTVDSVAAKSVFGSRAEIRNLPAGAHTARIYGVSGVVAIDAFAVEPQTIASQPVAAGQPAQATQATQPIQQPAQQPAAVNPTSVPPTTVVSQPANAAAPTNVLPTATAQMIVVGIPYSDTFDGGPAWTATGAWQIDTSMARQGQAWFAPTTQRGQVSALEQSVTIDLRAAVNPQITFWQKASLSAFDVVSVEVTVDRGASWIAIDQQTKLLTDWTQHTINLSAYKGQTIRLRFRIDATQKLDAASTTIGYWLDELVVAETPPAAPTQPVQAAPAVVTAAAPAPTNAPPVATVKPKKVQPTAVPPAAVPPTAVPPTAVPPTAVPPTVAPPATQVAPEAQPTQAPEATKKRRNNR